MPTLTELKAEKAALIHRLSWINNQLSPCPKTKEKLQTQLRNTEVLIETYNPPKGEAS